MTFAEFCATRRYAKDLGAVLGEDRLDGVAGFFYAGGLFVNDAGAYPLYIADRGAAPPGGARWHTTIDRRPLPAGSLEDLERSLYRFAKDAGFLGRR